MSNLEAAYTWPEFITDGFRADAVQEELELGLPSYEKQMQAELDNLVEQYDTSTRQFLEWVYSFRPDSYSQLNLLEPGDTEKLKFAFASVNYLYSRKHPSANRDMLPSDQRDSSLKETPVFSRKYRFLQVFWSWFLENAMAMHEGGAKEGALSERSITDLPESSDSERSFWEQVFLMDWSVEQAEYAEQQVNFWLNGTDPLRPKQLGTSRLVLWHEAMGSTFEWLREASEEGPEHGAVLIESFNHICQYHHDMADVARNKPIDDYCYAASLPDCEHWPRPI